MPRTFAVLFVHGVEISDEKYATTAVELLTEAFARRAGVSADDALARTGEWLWDDERRGRARVEPVPLSVPEDVSNGAA